MTDEIKVGDLVYDPWAGGAWGLIIEIKTHQNDSFKSYLIQWNDGRIEPESQGAANELKRLAIQKKGFLK